MEKIKHNRIQKQAVTEEEFNSKMSEAINPYLFALIDELTKTNKDLGKQVQAFVLKAVFAFYLGFEFTKTGFSDSLKKAFDQIPDEVAVKELDSDGLIFTDKAIDLFFMLKDSADWSLMTPMLYSRIYEYTINRQERRSGGMHYTSTEDIYKVIDPLFLDDLIKELDEIKKLPLEQRRKALDDYHEKLFSLTFLDPACGSGNFLFTTYQALRRLENEVIKLKHDLDKGEELKRVLKGLI